MDLLSGLVGSVVGAMAGFFGSWWAAERQALHQAKARASDEAALVAGFVGAIEAEFSVAWGLYEIRVRPVLSEVQDGEIFNFQWPVRHDYFPVYRANAGLLGRVKDNELRRNIVETYTAAQGLLDSLALNTEMVMKLERLVSENEMFEGKRQDRVAEHCGLLVAYAKALKNSDGEFAAMARNLLRALRAYR
jgi:hypothetical protein